MKMTKEEAFEMLQGKKVYAGEFTEEVQKKLFEIGYKWKDSGVQLLNRKFLMISHDYCLTYTNNYDMFLGTLQEEITISQILGIELEDEFKDGDICYSNNGAFEMLFIYKSKKSSSRVNYYCLVYGNGRLWLNDWCDTLGDIRFATDQEKQTLFNELYKQGYKWNAEEKKLEKKLWRAEDNGFYYIISDDLSVDLIQEENDYADNIYYDIKNYFKTKDEAQQYADKIKELLKNR